MTKGSAGDFENTLTRVADTLSNLTPRLRAKLSLADLGTPEGLQTVLRLKGILDGVIANAVEANSGLNEALNTRYQKVGNKALIGAMSAADSGKQSEEDAVIQLEPDFLSLENGAGADTVSHETAAPEALPIIDVIPSDAPLLVVSPAEEPTVSSVPEETATDTTVEITQDSVQYAAKSSEKPTDKLLPKLEPLDLRVLTCLDEHPSSLQVLKTILPEIQDWKGPDFARFRGRVCRAFKNKGVTVDWVQDGNTRATTYSLNYKLEAAEGLFEEVVDVPPIEDKPEIAKPVEEPTASTAPTTPTINTPAPIYTPEHLKREPTKLVANFVKMIVKGITAGGNSITMEEMARLSYSELTSVLGRVAIELKAQGHLGHWTIEPSRNHTKTNYQFVLDSLDTPPVRKPILRQTPEVKPANATESVSFTDYSDEQLLGCYPTDGKPKPPYIAMQELIGAGHVPTGFQQPYNTWLNGKVNSGELLRYGTDYAFHRAYPNGDNGHNFSSPQTSDPNSLETREQEVLADIRRLKPKGKTKKRTL
jgi:hypothetical protein